MKPKTAIEKGKRFEKLVSAEIEAEGLGKSVRTPGSGSGKIKGDLFNNLQFMFECKNQKTIHFLDWVDQAKEQSKIGNQWKEKWALITFDPRTTETNPSIYATIDLWEFLRLLKKNSEPIVKEPDKDAKWKIQKLMNDAKQVIKIFE